MQARSALFDLYGDYLRTRGSRAPVAALVRLLAPLGIAAPAVRTAVSRMVRQGWLHPLRMTAGPGYLLTPKAARRLDEAAARVYRTGRGGWDGRFDLIMLHDPPLARPEAERLAFLGYGSLSDQVWVAPRASDELDAVLDEAGAAYDRFSAAHTAGSPGTAGIVGRAWDLDRIGRSYREFQDELRPVVKAVTGRSPDEEAYAARFRLVHAWRSFLFQDPQLPAALLPAGWPGVRAALFFDKHAARLRPAADRYVERCLHDKGRFGQ
ncbi:PaaX family transcriptional regulator [Actinoplanes sp. SE50]|uniref:PaaX family transcriptional regulator n=1 Tax=unclassified Actinoplanes TaxID=2626549 RepID=UPI00023EDE68|nr:MULTISPECIES: PaaX family transcriptional regulator C-terminal domain-containing protein [unclassified Actinoplanes]AEV88725.1 Phenylacetic acid degradation operon negative regulatory protein paaX [Actinoplanes sp. SE50/110]ATO87129.1 PaaX family transcriptional regulator [Actinoplanes sp. SE50]SLM04547.1 PaaX family transcriptional regulator [Actinoplanes sp. SE50/110]